MFDSDNIQNILQKETTRREFLVHIGFSLAAVVGVSAIINNVMQFAGGFKSPNQLSHPGAYGAGGFSGVIADAKNSANIKAIK